MSIVDAGVIACLILLVPQLVKRHLESFEFGRELRIAIVLGGVLWITFSCMHELIYPSLGIGDRDAKTLEVLWYGSTVDTIEAGNYWLIVQRLLTPGRGFYATSQGLFYYFTGGTVVSVLALNAFMAFWGSLTLTRSIYCLSYCSSPTGTILPLFLIFAPSVVFWSSANLKEALMYWSICQVFAFIVPNKLMKQVGWSFMLFGCGVFIGLLLRPHIIIFWLVAVVLIKAFQPGLLKLVIVLLLILPIGIGLANKQLNLRSFENNIKFAEKNMRQIIARSAKYSFRNSTFDYGPNGPIPMLDGAINTAFRPILWRVGNMRSALSAAEIWAISLGILFLWFRATNSEWSDLIRNPLIRVATLVLIVFFWFLTYYPNEGLIARQRVQVFPALLVLFAVPILQRRANREAQSAWSKGTGG